MSREELEQLTQDLCNRRANAERLYELITGLNKPQAIIVFEHLSPRELGDLVRLLERVMTVKRYSS